MLGVAWGGALLGWGRGRLVRPLPCLGGGRPGRLWAPRFPAGVPLWGSPVGGLSPPLGAPGVVPPGGPPSGVWGGRRFKRRGRRRFLRALWLGHGGSRFTVF